MNFDELPIDITNIILIQRMYLNLEDLLDKYNINKVKLDEFLLRNSACLSGSSILSCLTLTEHSDIDIFIYKKEPNFDIKDYYKQFLNVFNDDFNTDSVNIIKSPICLVMNHKHYEKYSKYHYKFEYTRNFEYRYEKLSIDMLLLNDNPKEIFKKYKIFNISNVYYDGKNFNIPLFNQGTNNLWEFVDNKKIRISNPYITYFDTIYNAFGSGLDSDIIKLISKFKLDINPDLSNIYMKFVYNKFVGYYLNPSLKNMIKVYNKLKRGMFNTNLNKRIHVKLVKSIKDVYLYELYRKYKGIYIILKYINKGYIMDNIFYYIK
jgi:hypothetical protein